MNRLVTKLSMVVVMLSLVLGTNKTAFADGQEWCNGVDDDKDGLVDEDWPIGEPCWGGFGVCRAQGIWKCGLLELAVCVRDFKNVIDPKPEECNGLDDNCDGLIDNFAPMTCQVESEANHCSEGRLICSPSGEHLCIPIPPTAEVCGNNVDEDCDGVAQVCVGDPQNDWDAGVPGMDIDTTKAPEPNLGDACRPVYLKNDGCSLSPPSPHPLLPLSAVLVLIGGATLISRHRRLL
jgi:hypothetical protein